VLFAYSVRVSMILATLTLAGNTVVCATTVMARQNAFVRAQPNAARMLSALTAHVSTTLAIQILAGKSAGCAKAAAAKQDAIARL
jgi:hypothetical protein